ncbi:MAG: hypothetical protein COB76_02400 [Alphaproteobacteria bacterium]|nr:MAG: hypothetical protein COB76_02400 [Alphaproteobacteria bacterium]
MRHFIFLVAFLASTSVQARCYSSAEVEAEQGLRIHSELMVISLNCHKMSHRNGNLHIQYKDFTRRHQDLVVEYESTMKNYYRRTGHKNPERSINDLRTDLANKISTDAARMRPNVFCKYYGSRINQALAMDRAKLRRWAATVFPSHPVSKPICAATR